MNYIRHKERQVRFRRSAPPPPPTAMMAKKDGHWKPRPVFRIINSTRYRKHLLVILPSCKVVNLTYY